MNQPLKTTKPPALGRGLSALFGDTDVSYAAPKPASTEKSIKTMPVTWLQPGAMQPRQEFNDEALSELSASIKERGILQPILVRRLADASHKDAYEIIAGERRWRAAQLAGLHEVPVIIREFSDRESLEVAIIENVQRENLNPLEEAEGYERLMQEYKHTQDGLAKIVGKSRSHITNILRLLTLPLEVKTMLTDGRLTTSHARTLVTAKDPVALAREIVEGHSTVRQVEERTRAEAAASPSLTRRGGRPTREAAASLKAGGTMAKTADIIALEKQLSATLGLRTALTAFHNGSGKLVIEYQDLDQLDAVIKKLVK